MSQGNRNISQSDRELIEAIETMRRQSLALSEMVKANHELLKAVSDQSKQTDAKLDRLIQWMPGLANSR